MRIAARLLPMIPMVVGENCRVEISSNIFPEAVLASGFLRRLEKVIELNFRSRSHAAF